VMGFPLLVGSGDKLRLSLKGRRGVQYVDVPVEWMSEKRRLAIVLRRSSPGSM